MANVLVVDDEPDVRELLIALLESEGHQVAGSSDGKAGLRAYLTSSFDLVISDVAMPGVGGLGLVRRIRALETRDGRPPCPVIMVSARVSAADQELGIAAGATTYVTKPFEIDDFLRVVRELVAGDA